MDVPAPGRRSERHRARGQRKRDLPAARAALVPEDGSDDPQDKADRTERKVSAGAHRNAKAGRAVEEAAKRIRAYREGDDDAETVNALARTYGETIMMNGCANVILSRSCLAVCWTEPTRRAMFEGDLDDCAGRGAASDATQTMLALPGRCRLLRKGEFATVSVGEAIDTPLDTATREQIAETALGHFNQADPGLVEIKTEEARSCAGPKDGEPPEGTPETALIVVLDCDTYQVAAHTGHYFYWAQYTAGAREEWAVRLDMDIAPGVYVLENGSPGESRDWETGIPDDVWVDGDVRPATPADFARFGVAPMVAPDSALVEAAEAALEWVGPQDEAAGGVAEGLRAALAPYAER